MRGDSLVDKDGGRDCRIRSNNCYGQVIRRDRESALACWGWISEQSRRDYLYSGYLHHRLPVMGC